MNIYVGNLPKTTNEDTVRQLFEAYGETTEVKLLRDQYTGELRGFGFITMPSNEEAQKAIDGINGTELEGRTLVVNEARPRKDRSGGRHRGGGGGYQGSRSRSW
ncbi:MAG: RNA-binding protein [Calditrichaeota bacterium]|nr:RNA-binding protein [Calditrichota bacterium]